MLSVTKMFFIGLLIGSGISHAYGKNPADNQPLAKAYLEHWFSFDSSEPINLITNPLEDDEIGHRAVLKFTSDDGASVNGLIAYPAKNDNRRRLAFLLHPMGGDQQFWWKENPLKTNRIAQHLRMAGYIVITLDARRHGTRGIEGFGGRDLLKKAHSKEPRIYLDTIIGSVKDYRIILNWAKKQFEPEGIFVSGYSMGAQMGLLLASFEPSVTAILAMVPPYVSDPTYPVAPRNSVARIHGAEILWLAGSEDPYSTSVQTQETFDKIRSANKRLIWFESGHRLPIDFLHSVLQFIDSLETEKT